jgi:membrane protease YdiL (CAAX protease family)
MVGILVQLAISWLIIWLVEKDNLSVLGFYPTKKRLAGFAVFFFITAICCASEFLMRIYFAKEQWQLNPALSYRLLWEGLWWNIKSVLFEELIFRGVLLYLLIKKLGAAKGIIISAIGFGIYHWYSHEVIGDIKQMAITFTMTGIMGLLFAYAYAKTFSLYIPIAIHLGWNLTKGFIFSEGPIGNGVFIQKQPQPEVTVSYFTFFIILFLPILSMWPINYLLLRKHKQEPLPKKKNEKIM